MMRHSTFRGKKSLVYFLCEGDDSFFSFAGNLKDAGYEVHIFDDHDAMIRCCAESDLPGIAVVTVFQSKMSTWEFVQLLERVSRNKNVSVPVLVLVKNAIDVDVFVQISGLPEDSFLSYPIDQNVFLDRVKKSLVPGGQSRDRQVMFFTDHSFPVKPYTDILNVSGYKVTCFEAGISTDTPEVIENCSFTVIGAGRTGLSGSEFVRKILKAYPETPVIVMSDNLSSVQMIELAGTGIDTIIPGLVKPEIFLARCLNALSSRCIQKWMYQNRLLFKELEDKTDLYQHVLENQKDLICKWNPDNTLTFVNDAFCRSMNSNRKDLVGKKIPDFIVPDGDVRIEDITSSVLESGLSRTFEHGYIDSVVSVRWYHWTCSPVVSGSVVQTEILAVGRNISDMKRLEVSLAENNAELETLLATVPNQIWYLSNADTYRAANQAHAQFIGKPGEQLENCPIENVYSPEDVEKMRLLARKVMKTRKHLATEMDVTSGSGEKRVLSITQTPSLDTDGRVRFIVCSAIDVTSEREQDYRLAFRAEFEHLISETVSDFVQQDMSCIDRSIQTSLQKIAEFAGVNRAYIVFTENVEEHQPPNYFWVDNKSATLTGTINREYPAFFKDLDALKTICITDAAQIQKSAVREKEYFTEHRLKTLLIVPIEANRILAGYIVFESVEAHVVWESDAQVMMKVYGEVLLNTLQKARVSSFIKSERDFGLRLNFADSLDQWLNICLDYMMEVSESDVGGIYLTDEFDGSCKIAVYKNISEEFLNKTRVFLPESPQFNLISKGLPFYVSWDEMQTPERNYLVKEGFKSYSVLPVRFRENVIASVNVASTKRKRVPEFTISALETVISRLGPLIAKARADETIRRNQANLDVLFNSLKDYLIVTSETGKILHINKSCQHDLGYRFEDIRNTLFLNLYDSETQDRLGRFLLSDTGKRAFQCEGTILKNDDTPNSVDIRIVSGEWQEIPALYVFNHDLTEVKNSEKRKMELEREMLQAQKMESLSRMAGAIAHRFNNLLMGVVGNLELAKMIAGSESKVSEKISQAESASHKAIDLGRLMLTYVGQIGTNKVLCDLSDIIEKTLPLLQASAPAGAVFETDLDGTLPAVMADIGSLQQILMNLASNAWESFEDETGLILIETTPVNVPETFNEPFVENDVLPDGDYVCMTFTDNGSGMDRDTKDKMFDPFFTTKFTGRGLGLSAVLGIMRAHEGGITVFSEKRISTRISLLFPTVKHETTHVFVSHEENTSSLERQLVVLLVDDEDDVREVARQMLENLGCVVIPADNGHKAIKLLEKYKSQIRCVICDIKMPDMDGWDTMSALKKIRSDIPVALVTGFGLTAADMENRQEPEALIQKPYRFQNLLSFLKTV